MRAVALGASYPVGRILDSWSEEPVWVRLAEPGGLDGFVNWFGRLKNGMPTFQFRLD
jgi:hypothetical protein